MSTSTKIDAVLKSHRNKCTPYALIYTRMPRIPSPHTNPPAILPAKGSPGCGQVGGSQGTAAATGSTPTLGWDSQPAETSIQLTIGDLVPTGVLRGLLARERTAKRVPSKKVLGAKPTLIAKARKAKVAPSRRDPNTLSSHPSTPARQ